LDRLPDSREVWLEFWRENHLLDSFERLWARSESGPYGGEELRFLSLPDLIRSKETERARDWQDVATLGEFLDARHFAKAKAGAMPVEQALAELRSRRGLESFYLAGSLNETEKVEKAIASAKSIVTMSLLLPFAPRAALPSLSQPMETPIEQKLRTIPPLSGIHFALVEAVRRQYERNAMAIDRANKESIAATRDDSR
jgi:hypothetical protein